MPSAALAKIRTDLRLRIAGVADVVFAFVWSEVVEQGADAAPGGFDGPLVGLAEQSLELGEDLLDRVEVGRVGRQEEELDAGRPQELSHAASFVAAEVVDDDDAARLQLRD